MVVEMIEEAEWQEEEELVEAEEEVVEAEEETLKKIWSKIAF